MSLLADFEIRHAECRSTARKNDTIAWSLILAGVIFSSAATIAVGTDSLPRETQATLTALPGVVVVALNTFRFEARARWWWKKVTYFQKWIYALKYQGADEKAVSEEMAKVLSAHEDEWPSFGKPPSGIIT